MEREKRKLVSITGRLPRQFHYEGVQMTVWHAGICMPQPPAGRPGLTSRRPSDEWRLSIFMAARWSISLRPSHRRPPEEVFPGHLAEVKNKTVRMSGQSTHAHKHTAQRGMPSHKPRPLPGHMEMSAALQRCWLMSGHVAGLVPGHTHTHSSCAGEEGARRRAALTCPVPSPTQTTNPTHTHPTVVQGGKLIVSVIDCHGKSVLSGG